MAFQGPPPALEAGSRTDVPGIEHPKEPVVETNPSVGNAVKKKIDAEGILLGMKRKRSEEDEEEQQPTKKPTVISPLAPMNGAEGPKPFPLSFPPTSAHLNYGGMMEKEPGPGHSYAAAPVINGNASVGSVMPERTNFTGPPNVSGGLLVANLVHPGMVSMNPAMNPTSLAAGGNMGVPSSAVAAPNINAMNVSMAGAAGNTNLSMAGAGNMPPHPTMTVSPTNNMMPPPPAMPPVPVTSSSNGAAAAAAARFNVYGFPAIPGVSPDMSAAMMMDPSFLAILQQYQMMGTPMMNPAMFDPNFNPSLAHHYARPPMGSSNRGASPPRFMENPAALINMQENAINAFFRGTPMPSRGAYSDLSGEGFICDKYGCNFISKTPEMQAKHKEEAHTELLKPFECDYPGCNYASNHKGNLKSHQRKHRSEKPYKCTFEGCSYAAKWNSVLKRHLETHKKSRGRSV